LSLSREIFPPAETLTPGLRERLEREAEPMHVPKGHVFFEEGAPGDSVYVLRQGRVLIQHLATDGSPRTVCMIAPGELFCCMPVLDGKSYPATATAAVGCTVYRMSAAAYRGLFDAHAPFARASLVHLCRQLRQAQCAGVPCGDAGSRLAASILRMAEKFGNDVPLTRRELAELAGTTVETAIRETKQFERAGWIRLRRGHVEPLDWPALRARAGLNGGAASPSPAPPPRQE
jgi:CRP-like cAMP-binding protein